MSLPLMSATAKEKVRTLMCLSKVKDAKRREAAEAGLMVWIDRAHANGWSSLGAWMDADTAPDMPRR